MRVGESAQLQAVPADGSGRPYTGLFTLSWSSSAVLVATVSDTGQLTALADGMTVITAQATRLDTGAMASASVTLTVGSPMMVDTTPPSIPGGLMAAAASPTEVSLSWAASTDDVGVSGYRVLRAGTPIATVGVTNYSDAGLSAATSYLYAVVAFDAAGNTSAASAAVSVTTPGLPPPPPPPGGLIAAYGFAQGAGTTLGDASGNGHSGALIGGPAWAPGRNGGGLSFNGGAGYVSMGDVDAMDGLSRITASAWIRTTASGEKHILDKSGCDGASGGGPFELGTSFFAAGKATFVVYRTAGASTFEKVDSTTTVTDGAWHHVAGVYDGSSVLIYVDGTLQGTTAAPGITMPASGNAFELGGHCNGYAYPWDGSIDDVRIYGRALSAAEIAADMGAAVVDPVTGGADAGTTALDAGSAPRDAGTTPDAGTAPDAGSTPPDAGTTTPDAGTTTPDAGTAAAVRGLSFPSNYLAGDDIRLVWSGANLLSRTSQTVIWKARYRRQDGYYAWVWSSGSTGPGDWPANSYEFGTHPYPTTGSYDSSGQSTGGTGSSGQVQYYEIAGLGASDFIASALPLAQNATRLAYDVWVTQARSCQVVGGTIMRHTFWPDISRPDIFIQQDHPLAGLTAANPRFLLGCSPWREGFGGQGPTSNDECPSGDFRYLKLFNAPLSITDIAAEAASEQDLPVTAAGTASRWYSNINPTPSDVSDKSGAGHSPTWDNANRPGLYP